MENRDLGLPDMSGLELLKAIVEGKLPGPPMADLQQPARFCATEDADYRHRF